MLITGLKLMYPETPINKYIDKAILLFDS